jgi:hypothetical protein
VAEVDDPEGGANEKSCPVPLSATLWGLPAALSEMLNVPVLVPPAVGLKVTEMEQLAPALTLAPQVLVWEKSPLAVMPEMVNEELPAFVNVTDCAVLLLPDAWAANVREEGDKVTAGPEGVPVPLKLTFCGLPLALSVSVRLPELLPVVVGVNVTSITQLLLAATDVLVLQVVPLAATAKSPVAAMLVKLNDAVPLLVTVTALAALVVPSV